MPRGRKATVKPQPVVKVDTRTAEEKIRDEIRFHEMWNGHNLTAVYDKAELFINRLRDCADKIQRDLNDVKADPDGKSWEGSNLTTFARRAVHEITWMVPNLGLEDIQAKANTYYTTTIEIDHLKAKLPPEPDQLTLDDVDLA